MKKSEIMTTIRFILLSLFNLIVFSGPIALIGGIYIGFIVFAASLGITPLIMFAPFLGYELSDPVLTFLCAMILSLVGIWLLIQGVKGGKWALGRLQIYFRMNMRVWKGENI